MPLDSQDRHEQRFKVVGTRPIRPDGVDKVTGRARFGADMTRAGHADRQGPAQPARARAHPVDRHLDGGGAARREGGRHGATISRTSAGSASSATCLRNVMARDKALYDGHAVAAVAAINAVDRAQGARR